MRTPRMTTRRWMMISAVLAIALATPVWMASPRVLGDRVLRCVIRSEPTCVLGLSPTVKVALVEPD